LGLIQLFPLSRNEWDVGCQDFPDIMKSVPKASRIQVVQTDIFSRKDPMSHTTGPMMPAENLTGFLRDFEDDDLQRYTCFASEFRDQRMEAGSVAEAGFWNVVVNLCIDERMRRDQDIKRVEYMYRTGIDPEHHS
jgi:hypothetical protein